MTFGFNEEQRLLQDQIRTLLADHAAPDVLRKTINAGAPWVPELWTMLAELGVLGAGVPEAYGGVGLGPVEVAIVAQEIGRTTAPVPFFSSVCLATEALLIAGTEAQKEKWLPKLAAGEVVGTLAWTEGRTPPSAAMVRTTLSGGRLHGVKTPVPDAQIAQLCVVVAKVEGRAGLALVELDQAGVKVAPLRGIDELRNFAQVDFDRAQAEPMDAIDGAEALEQILDRAAVYEAFEQVGGAQAALAMTCDFTRQRYIFGRPLGSYQAVKHTLADIFARLELAVCNALYAAGALADGKEDARAAAATARIGATEVYEAMARQSVQYHGGIGFTWEANCHFHYRRARTLALNIGSNEFWSDRLIAALGSGGEERPEPERPAVRLDEDKDTPEDAAYRAKARAWIAEAAQKVTEPPAPSETPEGARRAQQWTRLKHAAGYSAIAHPVEFGGMGGTRRQQAIFAQEEGRAGMTMPFGGRGYAQAMAAITKHGTPEQRRKWESLTYAGEIDWCQLFSEPGAGSDLAAVRTRAVRKGDEWIVNGQKVWTSGGHMADWGILLARTDPDVPKHQGMSFFIIDMRQPGVEVRPIRQINGQSGFTETFFTDAVVKDEDRLDAEGQGWAVAMSVLAQERTTTRGIGEGGSRRTSTTSARNLIRLAREAPRETGSALDSAAVRGKIAEFHAQAQGIKNFTLRLQEEIARGGPPPTNLPVIKLTATHRVQMVQAFLMDLDEAGGIVEAVDADPRSDRFLEYLTSASSRIAGGADEVLRNQLAERALGLPGDIRADKDVPFSQLPT